MIRGFLGGTFDPVHLGHLALAQEAVERFAIGTVLFVPAKHPPHKDPAALTPFAHRLRMLELATVDNPFFQAADMEGETSPSYTVDLLERHSSPGNRPFFIMGMDSLCEMHTWKDPIRITELARVLVGVRPGYDPTGANPELAGRVEFLQFPGVYVSSSEIRKRAASGRSISYLVPGSVETYIRNRGLYGTKEGH